MILLFPITLLWSQDKYNTEKGENLIGGYDPVSYFNGSPKQGMEGIFVIFESRKILFNSTDNKKRFESDPHKFLPKYGGWCAMAMAQQSFRIPDHTFYKIQDGRLYFFSFGGFFDGLKYWNKAPEKNQALADMHYARYFQ